ncbi:MAG: glycosyltransferase family A protein [Pseudomonadota bacterium]
MPEESITFVIPHKGREELLRETLASISAQEGGHAISVVVVTQNTELAAATIAIANTLDAQLLYADDNLTISALRNLGAAQSNSTYLAFLDADIALSANWLSALLEELLADHRRVLVSAIQRTPSGATMLEQIRTVLSNAVADAAVEFLPGRNLLLRRDAYESVGGFPDHLRTCEDYWFTSRVGEAGLLWYSSSASYVHLGEDRSLRALFAKEIWRGQSNLQSIGGRRIGPGEWPSFLVPPWISLLGLLALVFLLAGQGLVASACAILAGLPFAAYVTRLYFLGRGQLSLPHVVAFYAVYFPARAWGTFLGTFRGLGSELHDH